MKLNRYLYFEYPCTIILVYDIYTNRCPQLRYLQNSKILYGYLCFEYLL